MTRSSVDLEEAGPASFEELRVRDCSIKRTLDVVGEKWTLLVLREAFYGARRFEEFLANVGCARTLLSERLATLVQELRARSGPNPRADRALVSVSVLPWLE